MRACSTREAVRRYHRLHRIRAGLKKIGLWSLADRERWGGATFSEVWYGILRQGGPYPLRLTDETVSKLMEIDRLRRE